MFPMTASAELKSCNKAHIGQQSQKHFPFGLLQRTCADSYLFPYAALFFIEFVSSRQYVMWLYVYIFLCYGLSHPLTSMKALGELWQVLFTAMLPAPGTHVTHSRCSLIFVRWRGSTLQSLKHCIPVCESRLYLFQQLTFGQLLKSILSLWAEVVPPL